MLADVQRNCSLPLVVWILLKPFVDEFQDDEFDLQFPDGFDSRSFAGPRDGGLRLGIGIQVSWSGCL